MRQPFRASAILVAAAILQMSRSAGLPATRRYATSPSSRVTSVPSVQGIEANLSDFLAAHVVAPLRTYRTGFESASDFQGFYLVPQNYLGTSSYSLSTEQVHAGTWAHKGWIYGENPVTEGENTNHRGYPTIQLYKTAGGAYQSHVLVQLWVWLDMKLENVSGREWVSFATLTPYADDLWPRTIQVNLNSDGFVALEHVPEQGEFVQDIYQPNEIPFVQKRWVKLTIYLDFTATNQFHHSFAAVWQDETLVSASRFNQHIDPLTVPRTEWPSCLDTWDGVAISQAEQLCGAIYAGGLAQAHFGLYAPPGLASGTIYNDDLAIEEVVVK